jgi:DNA-binding Lrp family transcriptional regulator
MPANSELDRIDCHILSELQENGRIQNNLLADRVGLSPPPCLRRVRNLLDRGVIRRIRARLDEKQLGYDVTSFVEVELEIQTESALAKFEAHLKGIPFVLESWLISGQIDYLIKCVAFDLDHMRTQLNNFAAVENVRKVKSLFVLREIKDAILPIKVLRSASI